MFKQLSNSLKLQLKYDAQALQAIGGSRYCLFKRSNTLKRRYGALGHCRMGQHYLQLRPLLGCSYSSYDRIKDDTVLFAKDMRKLLKEYVGSGLYSDTEVATAGLKDEGTPYQMVGSQDELVTRSMRDSICKAVLPLGDDLHVRDKYLTFYKTVRIGKLLEDMDTIAGLVGYKFYEGPSRYEGKAPFALVTASVDNFEIKENFIRSDRNIWMTGFVSYAGRTSLEVTIQLDQDDGDSRKRIADAMFVMVARDPVAQKGVLVNKLVPATSEEEEIYRRSKIIRNAKKLDSAQSVFKTPPTVDEKNIIHNLFLNTLDPKKSTFHSRVKPENTVWMEQTRLKNLIICHPQSRNVYNKIFGGFLMREAFELGWATTCVHIKSRPTVVCMDDINFQKPVEVGSLLFLSSQIVYTEGNYLQTRVHAEVLDPKTGDISTTNVFHFHFTSKTDFPDIIPMSYGEYMLYLEGRRHSISYRQMQDSQEKPE